MSERCDKCNSLGDSVGLRGFSEEFVCGKWHERRQDFFAANQTMDFLDRFRFSPNRTVPKQKGACRHFTPRGETK